MLATPIHQPLPQRHLQIGNGAMERGEDRPVASAAPA
jgi:hypothetical protein